MNDQPPLYVVGTEQEPVSVPHGALSPEALASYTKIGTGEKYLINPHKK